MEETNNLESMGMKTTGDSAKRKTVGDIIGRLQDNVTQIEARIFGDQTDKKEDAKRPLTSKLDVYMLSLEVINSRLVKIKRELELV